MTHDIAEMMDGTDVIPRTPPSDAGWFIWGWAAARRFQDAFGRLPPNDTEQPELRYPWDALERKLCEMIEAWIRRAPTTSEPERATFYCRILDEACREVYGLDRAEIIINMPLRDRVHVDAVLAACTPDDLGWLRMLRNIGLLRGDWRRAAVCKRIEDLREEAGCDDEDGEGNE